MMVLRAATFDAWVAASLADNPSGTVVELGTGLNTRFERPDNGTVRWFDLDLPYTIELRRRFFTDCDRRRMLATSILDEGWLNVVRNSPGPYFFVADGVLVYLPEKELMKMLRRIPVTSRGRCWRSTPIEARCTSGSTRWRSSAVLMHDGSGSAMIPAR